MIYICQDFRFFLWIRFGFELVYFALIVVELSYSDGSPLNYAFGWYISIKPLSQIEYASCVLFL